MQLREAVLTRRSIPLLTGVGPTDAQFRELVGVAATAPAPWKPGTSSCTANKVARPIRERCDSSGELACALSDRRRRPDMVGDRSDC